MTHFTIALTDDTWLHTKPREFHLAGEHDQQTHGRRWGEADVNEQIAAELGGGRIRGMVELRDAIGVEHLADIVDTYHYTDAASGLHFNLTELNYYDGELQVAGVIYSPDGKANLGEFKQRLYPLDHTIELTELYLNTSIHELGVGTSFFFRMEGMGERHGYETITLLANADVGGYAWTRMGVEPGPRGLALMKERIGLAYEHVTGEKLDTTTLPSTAHELATYVIPASPEREHRTKTLYYEPSHDDNYNAAQLIELSAAEHRSETCFKEIGGTRVIQLGKAALLGMTWYGKASLDKSDPAYQAGQAYKKAWAARHEASVH